MKICIRANCSHETRFLNSNFFQSGEKPEYVYNPSVRRQVNFYMKSSVGKYQFTYPLQQDPLNSHLFSIGTSFNKCRVQNIVCSLRNPSPVDLKVKNINIKILNFLLTLQIFQRHGGFRIVTRGAHGVLINFFFSSLQMFQKMLGQKLFSVTQISTVHLKFWQIITIDFQQLSWVQFQNCGRASKISKLFQKFLRHLRNSPVNSLWKSELLCVTFRIFEHFRNFRCISEILRTFKFLVELMLTNQVSCAKG